MNDVCNKLSCYDCVNTEGCYTCPKKNDVSTLLCYDNNKYQNVESFCDGGIIAANKSIYSCTIFLEETISIENNFDTHSVECDIPICSFRNEASNISF